MPTAPPRRPARPGRSGPARVALALVLVAATALACGTDRAPDPAPPLAVDPSGTVGAAPSPTAPGSPAPGAPASTTPAVPACVSTAVDRLGERRFGQLVMGGLPAAGATAAATAALRAGAGGVIVVDGNTASAGAVATTVAAAQRTATATGGPGLLVSTDQEGGQVQKLRGPGFSRIPAASAQGADPSGLAAAARGWGRELRTAGLTVDLAPVADVVDPALGTANATDGRYGRQYGTDVATARAGVGAFVTGMRAAGVAPTLKHFPGLGKVRQNTDFAGGVVDTTTSADDPDLGSFRAGIAAGAPLVMMSSARYAKIDPDNRALFSPTVMNDVLRGRLGFGGVIMTDDVGVAKALSDVPVPERATRFVAAGGDLVLDVVPDDVPAMIDALRARADADPAFRARADDAVRRVLALKAAQGTLACGG